MNTLAEIRRHPLKSAAAEHLTETAIGERGLDGDRIWACFDADGTIGTGKQPRLWGALLDVAAEYLAARDEVRLTVPGAAPVTAGTPEADAALSDWLARPVRVTRTAPQEVKRHHWWPDEPGMIPEWAADVEPGGETVQRVGGAADGRFFDFGPLHLVTTGAVAQLGDEHGSAVDPTRFRPNLILDLPADPQAGQRIAIGDDVLLEVTLPTPRCIIPSIAHGPAPADKGLLKTLAAHHRIEVPGFGRATCFGFYADVLSTGDVRVGDEIRFL
ncbi:MOSC domain-containing protein [Glycomyces endophyticus]|uniref:MOSC domain-containing protein n=1 Tax=Glycomyces endophyticus TaxID=480996 RepID=A0ABP4RUV5_9ACTN